MSLEVNPFKVHFSDQDIQSLKTQVKAAHIARPTFEASAAAGGRLGVTREWLLAAKARWEDGFDWRAQEARINEVSHFTALVPQPSGSPFKMHFVHERSAKPHARTILLLHGWPGSYLEFIEVVKVLRDSGVCNVIVPSMPGYLFSDAPPLDADFNLADVAQILTNLMMGLGYEKYGIQAGDFASRVARILAVKYDSVYCVHFNMINIQSPPTEYPISSLTDLEEMGLGRAMQFVESGQGYSTEHKTRPATVGFVIAASPIALLAWVGEKFLEWSDKDPSIDEILTSVTAWYLTDTFPSSIYNYRDFVTKPTAYSSFAAEIMVTPRTWAATTCNLVWHKYHSKGGHFAAMEEPALLAGDIRAFLEQVWPIQP